MYRRLPEVIFANGQKIDFHLLPDSGTNWIHEFMLTCPDRLIPFGKRSFNAHACVHTERIPLPIRTHPFILPWSKIHSHKVVSWLAHEWWKLACDKAAHVHLDHTQKMCLCHNAQATSTVFMIMYFFYTWHAACLYCRLCLTDICLILCMFIQK